MTKSNVIPISRTKRMAQKSMTGGKGDQFRTAEAQDEFRRRYNEAMRRLAK